MTLNRIRDSPANPALTGFWYTNSDDLKADDCVGFCNSENFIYAGVETGTDCCEYISRASTVALPHSSVTMLWILILDCGNVLTPGSNKLLASDCSSICSGDPNQSCGGPNSLDMYKFGNIVPPQPVVVENVGDWHYAGCYRLAFFLFGVRPVTDLYVFHKQRLE